MPDNKKTPGRKSTIGNNPLDQLELVKGKNWKKPKLKDARTQEEIKQILLKKQRPKKIKTGISGWFKSILKNLP